MQRAVDGRVDDSLRPTFAVAPELPPRRSGPVEVLPLGRGSVHHDGTGTMFVVTAGPATVEVAAARFPVPGEGWAVLPQPASVEGGNGVAIIHRAHRGLFGVGGPAERVGRLRYIDGCSDTVLVSPVVRGDPCLNLLHLPPGTVQTDHDHPSIRVGLILSGRGVCVLAAGDRVELAPGVAFVLPAGATHRFETTSSELRLVAWHPDSDVGPCDDDHPMLNRTLRPGTTSRVR